MHYEEGGEKNLHAIFLSQLLVSVAFFRAFQHATTPQRNSLFFWCPLFNLNMALALEYI